MRAVNRDDSGAEGVGVVRGPQGRLVGVTLPHDGDVPHGEVDRLTALHRRPSRCPSSAPPYRAERGVPVEGGGGLGNEGRFPLKHGFDPEDLLPHGDGFGSTAQRGERPEGEKNQTDD